MTDSLYALMAHGKPHADLPLRMTPVKSSHIAAVGYLEGERVLMVRYKDGTLYAFPEISLAEYQDLLSAESKGKWLSKRHGLNEVKIFTKTAVPPDVPMVEGNPTAPLNVIDQEADKCCRKWFSGRLREGLPTDEKDLPSELYCPSCSQVFRREMVGSIRHWRIVPQVHIVRPR